MSQFTLHATMKNGTRPSFHRAMPPSAAESLYARFVVDITEALGEDRVQDGKFGAMMTVHIENDGPVTMVVDSRE